MENEKLLPKPLTDLPLPEKDLPAGRQEIPEHIAPASKGLTFQGYFQRLPLIPLILVILVVLFILVGGAYFLGRNSVFKELNPTAPEIPPPGPLFQASPTPASNSANASQTANWITYGGKNFSVKYPPFLKVTKSNNIIFFSPPEGTAYFTISDSKSEAENPEKLKKCSDLGPDPETCLGDDQVVKNITLSGVPAKEFYVSIPIGTTTHEIQIQNPFISIVFWDKGKDYFDQILSTFKFTNSGQAGVSGKIILSPTCGGPAQTGENCTKPYKATVIVKNKNGKEITRFTSDVRGNFSVKLDPGIYILEPVNKPNDIYPVGKPQEVKVTDGKMTDVTIIYETGML